MVFESEDLVMQDTNGDVKRMSSLPRNHPNPVTQTTLEAGIKPGFISEAMRSGEDEADEDIDMKGLEMLRSAAGSPVAPSKMELGEVIQQFSTLKNTCTKKTGRSEKDVSDKDEEIISMGDLIDALNQDHDDHVDKQRMAQAPRGPRRFAEPRGRWNRGRRFVHADDLLENNNNYLYSINIRRHPPRPLLDSYRPYRDEDGDTRMADSSERGPREDRGYDRGGDRGDRGGRGGFNRKRRFRGE